MTQATPKGFRLHIGLFGRRNVGKSSLLNAVTRQQVSIVSEQAGTTTDPVEKPMELLPLGPVLFIDTAGIDDAGSLGQMRIGKTRKAFDRTDLGVIVSDGSWGDFEEIILRELKERNVPAIAVFNKSDRQPPSAQTLEYLGGEKIQCIHTTAVSGDGIGAFRQALLDSAPADFIENPVIAADLVGSGGMAVLVVPIDKEAPKGRLILPQVQTIRDLLDHDAMCIVVNETELSAALGKLKTPPALVVTDSQAFEQVAADSSVSLTTIHIAS